MIATARGGVRQPRNHESNSRLPPVEVRVAQRFRASAERVFNAWVDPGTAGRWLFATALRPMSGVSIDARAGGASTSRAGETGRASSTPALHRDRPAPAPGVYVSCGQCADEVARVRVEIVPLAADAICVWFRRTFLRTTRTASGGAGTACCTVLRRCSTGAPRAGQRSGAVSSAQQVLVRRGLCLHRLRAR